MSDPFENSGVIALLAAVAAVDAVALAHFAGGLAVHRKADGSPVTNADHACEAMLIAEIQALFPLDSLWSEERGPVGPTHATLTSGCRWVVDPIDGTSALVEGLAHWGPTFARLDAEGNVLLGITSLPRLAETWIVVAGRALFRRGLAGAWTVLPKLGNDGAGPGVMYVPSGLHRGARLGWEGKARCLGGTAAHLALVARGAAAAVLVGPEWQPWDVATGLGLIEAVGGVARRLPDGAPLRFLADAGSAFVAGIPAVVDRLLARGALQPL